MPLRYGNADATRRPALWREPARRAHQPLHSEEGDVPHLGLVFPVISVEERNPVARANPANGGQVMRLRSLNIHQSRRQDEAAGPPVSVLERGHSVTVQVGCGEHP